MTTPTQALSQNWRLKLAALGLSVFLWALVQTEPSNQETFVSVPVMVQVSDTGWTTSGAPSPSTVELRLGGPAREIIRLAREGMSIRIPIDVVGSQDTLIVLRREWVELGQRSGLSVESMSPSTIRVSFEEAQTRLVPVASRLVGRVRDHLALAAPVEVSPQIVRVRGPRSRVEGLDSLRLEAFDLSDVARSGAFTVSVDTTGLLGASVVPNTATIGVRVEDMIERVLDGITVQAIADPGEDQVVADPSVIQVRLVGARTLVTSLDPERLRVWVPPEYVQGLAPGEERVVNVRIEGVPALVTAIPGTDRVTVRRAIDQAGLPSDAP
ncbi:MAG: CdaR family protein [Longimicrobiales bacterium]